MGTLTRGKQDADTLIAFIFGEEMSVDSTNISWAKWDAWWDVLTIGYLDMSIYEYSGVTQELAEDFANAPSKGHWRHVMFPRGASAYKKVS